MPALPRVVVDTDGGLDDAMALIHLARSPAVDLVAVSSVHGNVTTSAAAANSLRALELAGDEHTPVAVGAAAAPTRELQLRHPEDPFGSAAGPPSRATNDESAADQLVRLARTESSFDVLALGPMTNLAAALIVEPRLPQLVGRLVAMAGAYTVPGNVTPLAETNVWNDPDAFAAVLAAGFDLTLVGLDVTRQATATRDWLAQLDPTQLWGQYAAVLLSDAGAELPALPLHDPLAAAVLIDPTLVGLEDATVTVSTSHDERRGQTILTTPGAPGAGRAHVASTVDHERFLTSLLPSLGA